MDNAVEVSPGRVEASVDVRRPPSHLDLCDNCREPGQACFYVHVPVPVELLSRDGPDRDERVDVIIGFLTPIVTEAIRSSVRECLGLPDGE
jgi:hypothetical protein